MCACVHVFACVCVYEETNAMCLQTKYENFHVSFSVTNQYPPIYAQTILIILLTQQFWMQIYIYLFFCLEVGEMTQAVKHLLAMQAWGPEFRPLAPGEKLGEEKQ